MVGHDATPCPARVQRKRDGRAGKRRGDGGHRRRPDGGMGGWEEKTRAEAPGASPRGRRAEEKITVRMTVRMTVTDRHSDRHFLSPLVWTEKTVRKGVTPFAPYIILYKGAGRGVGFWQSTRGPSIVQGPTFQTGPAAVRSPATGGTPSHVALLGGLRHGISGSPRRRATARLLK